MEYKSFDVTLKYQNTENYMNDIAFLLLPDLKKKKIDLLTLPIFRPKGQTNLLFF